MAGASSVPGCVNVKRIADGTSYVLAQSEENWWLGYPSSQASCVETFSKSKNAVPVRLYFFGTDQKGHTLYWAEKNAPNAAYSASRREVIKGFGSHVTFDLQPSASSH